MTNSTLGAASAATQARTPLGDEQQTAGTAASTTAAPSLQPTLPFTQFVWGAGIECSFLPHLDVDQFQWTQHNKFWRDDFKLAKNDLGVSHLRYAFPWHVLEPKRGTFDWSYADERVEEAQKLGLDLMLDVMHFGTPLWLKQAVGDPEFPEALEEFAYQMVTRYRSTVSTWCPFNEPLVSALFSGDFGFWPPHARHWRGYMPVLSRIVQGVSRGMRAIRGAMPEATVLLCDAAENYKTRSERLQPEVARRNARRFLVMDLLLGKVDKHHPLYSWVNSYGLSDLDLDWFRTHPQAPDVLGLDYYPHSDWQLDEYAGKIRQRRSESPAGIYGVANAYYQRYGIPLMLTETSIEGQAINREIWLETNVEQIQRLREEGVPMLGLIWWPMIDQIDWDGALTHRVGKIHQVGLYNLKRQADGSLARIASPLVKLFKQMVGGGEEKVGRLDQVVTPSFEAEAVQLPPVGEWIQPTMQFASAGSSGAANGNGHSNGNGHLNGNGNGASALAEPGVRGRLADPAPGLGAESAAETLAKVKASTAGAASVAAYDSKYTDRYGIVVFSHLRWGFVWQRPQQFLSRFAKKHPILFIEEPIFDLKAGSEPRLDYHRVMPNVTVACPHMPDEWSRSPKLPDVLRAFAKKAIDELNDEGAFDAPVLWYYSPMDASWSLGHFPNRGIVYDSMDELSQFTGAPKQLVDNEARLMRYADVVFAGGYELAQKKKQRHQNVHFFGCGVEVEHFGKAREEQTTVPPDIDFMNRPILGWFGVVDERVDYAMVGEMARMRPDWSFAMVGPVVKVDPNLLPHSPNLFWLGGRDYTVLPNYCKAFDINMMCFAINAATEYINPTKALEYLATGRPVISTPVKDVVRQYTGLIDIVKTAEEFVATADRLLANPPVERIQKGIELATGCSWENTVAQMQRLIKEAITRNDRPSKQHIEPLPNAELEYLYTPTQGS